MPAYGAAQIMDEQLVEAPEFAQAELVCQDFDLEQLGSDTSLAGGVIAGLRARSLAEGTRVAEGLARMRK